MPEWWTYSLSDFLMFSPRTWFRLVERYNAAVWPAQIAGVTAGAAAAALVMREAQLGRRVALVLLAASWSWVAWAFLLSRYATINWAAKWFALAFLIQAALLLASALVCPERNVREGGARAIGAGLLLTGLVVYPLLGPVLGRGWAGAQTFGLMPEPTAIATTGVLLAAGPRRVVVMQAIPVLWLAIAALTLWAMRAPERWVVGGCLGAAIVGVNLRRRANEAGASGVQSGA